MIEEKRLAEFDNNISVYLSVTNLERPPPDGVSKYTGEIIRPIPQNARYWVDTLRDHYVFTNQKLAPNTRTRRRALAWAAVISKTDCRDDEADSGYVPVSVSTHGKPYVAAYLFSIHDQSIEEIAQEMNLTSGTISQYVSDIVSGRR